MFARCFLIFSLIFSSLFVSGCSENGKKKYTVAVDPLWYPLDFMNQENNVLGFSTELLMTIGQNENLNIALLNTNWDTLYQGLRSGSYQGILSSLYPYNFNKSQYDFSEVYLPLGPVLILPSSTKTTTLEKMKDMDIGVLSGSASSLITEKNPNLNIHIYDKPASLVNDILSGRINGGLLPILIASSFANGSLANEIKIASKPLNEEGLRLITLKGKSSELLKSFNKELKKLEKDGGYEKLLSKWDLND
jgi:polar amino acid transport system substrate-binding protein